MYKRINAFDLGGVIDVQYTFGKGTGIKLNLKYMQDFSSPYKLDAGGRHLNAVINLGVGIPTRIFTGKKAENIPDH